MFHKILVTPNVTRAEYAEVTIKRLKNKLKKFIGKEITSEVEAQICSAIVECYEKALKVEIITTVLHKKKRKKSC